MILPLVKGQEKEEGTGRKEFLYCRGGRKGRNMSQRGLN